MVRCTLLGVLLVLGLSACSRTPAPAPQAATSAPSLPAAAGAIETYVKLVEAEYRDRYERREVALTAEMLQDVSQMPWEKLHAYVDNGQVKRIKLYPPANETKMEEFYYREGRLVYVSIEPNGDRTSREQLFFGEDGKLIGQIAPDGSIVAVGDGQRALGEKMLREAQALLKIAGG